MMDSGPVPHFFSADESHRRRRRRHPEEVSGVGEGQAWSEAWSRPPSPRRSRWGPEEGPGMPPPGWGMPGLGPPPPPWERGFPPREGREGPWTPLEEQEMPPQDPRWREWGGIPGDDEGLNSSCREGPWNGPGPQRWWGPPSRDAGWECFESADGNGLGWSPGGGDWGHRGSGRGRGRWNSCPKWGRQEDPGNWNQNTAEPFLMDPGRSRWDSPERWREEHQNIGREMRSWGSPEKRQFSPSCEKRGWGPGHHQREPRGQHCGSGGQPVMEPFQADSARNESSWRGMERREEERLSPDRAKRQKSPTGDHRSWGRPELECPGSFGSRNQPTWEQSQSNTGEGGWDIPKRRGGEHPSANLGKREWDCPEIVSRQPSSDRVQQGCGGSARSERGKCPDESQVDTGACKQERQEECSYAREGSLERSGSPPNPSLNISPAAPKQWTPREQVVSWWMRCQSVLRKKVREQFLAVCPRPTLPDGTSETPRLNEGIMTLLSKPQMTELVTGPQTTWRVQEEVLDMLAPALTIYEMAEEAIEKDEQVDPMELREWTRQLVRHIGSINQRLTLQRRWHVLHVLNPRLKSLTSKMIGQSTNGMLFAEDKAKLLLEIIKRFPQLTDCKLKPAARKNSQERKSKNKAASKWNQNPLQSHYRPKGIGSKSYRPNTANWQAEQNHQ